MYKKIKEYGCIYLYFKILGKKKNFLKNSHSIKAWKVFFNVENGHVYTIFIRPLKEMLCHSSLIFQPYLFLALRE